MLARKDLLPLTKEFGLIRAPLDQVVPAFVDWIRRHTLASTHTRQLTGDVKAAILALLPITTPVSTRHLWLSSRSDWSVYMDNGRLGTNASNVAPVLSSLCRTTAVRAHASEQERGPDGRIMRYGGAIFEMYDLGKPTRTIFSVNDGGRWRFGESGKALPFEEPERYASRAVRERFTHEMLGRYMGHLGADVLDDSWLVCDAERPDLMDFLWVTEGEVRA
jgi:hypothetical protein